MLTTPLRQVKLNVGKVEERMVVLAKSTSSHLLGRCWFLKKGRMSAGRDLGGNKIHAMRRMGLAVAVLGRAGLFAFVGLAAFGLSLPGD